MKAGFIVGICFCFLTSWGQSDSTTLKPGIVHISSSAPIEDGSFLTTYDTLSVDSEFAVFSLVSKEMFDNWNTAELKSKFAKKACLFVVSREDSRQKTDFVLSFYKKWNNTKSIQKAYEMTVKEARATDEIKHFLIVNKE